MPADAAGYAGASGTLSAEEAGRGGASAELNCTELVVGGGFETPVISGPYSVFEPGEQLGAWEVGGTTVDIVTAAYSVFDGAQAIDLAGSPNKGSVEQTLSTIDGAVYTLRFALSSNGSAKSESVTVFWDDIEVATLSTARMGTWEAHEYELTAVGSDTSLRFQGNVDGVAGALLDAVSVNAVGCE